MNGTAGVTRAGLLRSWDLNRAVSYPLSAGGSVITAVNGQPVSSPDQLASIPTRLRPGTTISVTWVSPAGQHATSSLRLAAGPPQ